MAVVYVTNPGSKVHLEGNHLAVRAENFQQTIYTFNLERLVLVGKVEISHAALVHMFRNGVNLVFLNRRGKHLGGLSGVFPKNVFLRVEQYKRLGDNGFRLKTGRWIIAGKIRNMRTLVMRLGRTLGLEECRGVSKRLAMDADNALAADNLETLRGVEGAATRRYFSAYRLAFDKRLGFVRRVRRPPTDPVNACLSFGYTVLMGVVHGAVCAASLDPALGNLHELSYGRDSLTLDLMEEFRTPVVDMAVLACFNMGVLKADDFVSLEPGESRDPDGNLEEGKWVESVDMLRESSVDLAPLDEGAEADGPVADSKEVVKVYFKPEARKRFLTRIEKRLDKMMHYPHSGKSLALRDIIHRQASRYAGLVRGEEIEYEPICPR